VVLGAYADNVSAALFGVPVIPIVNPEWNQGMGTSIATGVNAILRHAPAIDAVLLMLADQPLVEGAALRRLLDAWTACQARSRGAGFPTDIAAAAYAGTIGVPAVFGRAHFAALCSLPSAAGAAGLLRQADAPVHRVVLPEAAVDIDTLDDLHAIPPGRES
jgi:CTP:molybdopterin cytidylyltransferase MocA